MYCIIKLSFIFQFAIYSSEHFKVIFHSRCIKKFVLFLKKYLKDKLLNIKCSYVKDIILYHSTSRL
jgi:hypothetical protein